MDEINLDLPTIPGIELLQKAPLFAKLGFAETMELATISHIEQHEDGAVIIAQDSLGGALYVLKEGTATVRFHERGSSDHRELATLKRGELFGEMTLIDDTLASADVIAKGKVELLVIPRKKFDLLLASNVNLAVKIYRSFCRSLTDKLRRANLRMAELGQHAEKR